MQRDTVPKGEKIYVQGEPVCCFYIVVSGLVMLKESSENGGLQLSSQLLSPGDVFGKEYALRWPSITDATAVAMESTQMIALQRDDYEAVIEHFKKERIAEYCYFLQTQVDFMSEWPAGKVAQVASRIQNLIVEDREEVAKAGDVIEGLHFVWAGALRLVRTFEHVTLTREKVRRQAEIAQLLSGEYVGEEPCLRLGTSQAGVPRHPYDVVAINATELLFVRTADILQHFRGFKSSAKKIKQAHRYPDDNTLREQVDEQLVWEDFKEHYLHPLYKPEPPPDPGIVFRGVRMEPFKLSR